MLADDVCRQSRFQHDARTDREQGQWMISRDHAAFFSSSTLCLTQCNAACASPRARDLAANMSSTNRIE
jgi:hypothetical protein